MDNPKVKLLIFGVGGTFLLFLILALLGVIPVTKKQPKNISPVGGQNVPKTPLTLWLFDEEEKNLRPFIDKFNALNNAEVKVRSFAGVNYNSYLNALLQALAEGKGPDVFTIPSSEIPVFIGKTIPLPLNAIPKTKLNDSFPEIVLKDVILENGIYGFPISIDTLALIYNKDIFAKFGIVFPPQNWDEFAQLLKKITIKDENGNIVQAGTALGGTNVEYAQDIIYAILLQLGRKVTSEGKGTLTNNESLLAFKFFRQFAQPKSEYFTWDLNIPNSIDAFAKNKVAMIFGYHSTISTLKEKNSFLNFGIAPFPQLATTSFYADTARYNIFVVSKQTKNPALSWNFITSLTMDPGNAEEYVKISGKPPALLPLIEKFKDDPLLSPFVRQALYAKSWYGPKREAIDEVILQTINESLQATKDDDLRRILSKAEAKITTIINSIY